MDAVKIVGAHGNRRKLDFYPTPPECTQSLIDYLRAAELLQDDQIIWEPAAGLYRAGRLFTGYAVDSVGKKNRYHRLLPAATGKGGLVDGAGAMGV